VEEVGYETTEEESVNENETVVDAEDPGCTMIDSMKRRAMRQWRVKVTEFETNKEAKEDPICQYG
jgi:hypothetical protein